MISPPPEMEQDIEKIGVFDPKGTNKDFFRYHPNYSYTSLALKQKRLLSHVTKALLTESSNPRMASFTLLVLLAVYDQKYDKCEDALLDVQL